MSNHDWGLAALVSAAALAIVLASCGGPQYTPDVEFGGATIEVETAPGVLDAEVTASASCPYVTADVEATLDVTEHVALMTQTSTLYVVGIRVISSLVCDLRLSTCEWCVWALKSSEPLWCVEWGDADE